jgi:hypothetical protein
VADAAARPAGRRALAWGTLGGTLAFVALLCVAGAPRWETNDDVAMAMVAHGFGLALRGSPDLVFSNVLWGGFVRALPQPFGILGYAWATLGALVVAGWTAALQLRRLDVPWRLVLPAVALVLAPAVVLPQFTLVAGLLTAASVLVVLAYARNGGAWLPAAAAALAFAGFLVRHEEALLVGAIAAPLLPWRVLARDRRAWIALGAMLVAMLVATGIDRRAYAGADWQAFAALDAPRAQFTDYDAGVALWERHPDLAARHGYSHNDLELVGNFFFADPVLANPGKLDAMLAELGPLPAQAGAFAHGLDAMAALLAPRLLPLALCALALALACPRRALAAAWAVLLAAAFAIGASGRPGLDVLRVFVPPLALLAWAALVPDGTRRGTRDALAFAALMVALVVTGVGLAQAARTNRALTAMARADLVALPRAPLAVWGNAFPYTAAFPVLQRRPQDWGLRIDSLGTDTLAPYSVAGAERATGHGLLDRLRSRDGLLLVATDSQLTMLDRYCAEHLGSRLQVLDERPLRLLRLRTVRCLPRAP